MNLLRFRVCLGFAALALSRVSAEENFWPVKVTRTDKQTGAVSWQAAGPLIFKRPAAESGTVSGFRPLFAQWRTPTGEVRETNFLYPVFTYRTDGETYRWSFLQLINRSGDRAGHRSAHLPSLDYETFDLWPFWFSRETGGSAGSYHALFPVAGVVKDRFGFDRITWLPFPLYLRTEKRGAVTTSVPWPIIRVTQGTEHGFALWPVFGWRSRPEVFKKTFFLWPVGWNNTIQPNSEAPPGTPARREVGFLPFYTRETREGFINENFLWPFFGYTDRTAPVPYHENRYLWPFLVQGRGPDQMVERFAPFYTHSIRKGIDKKWVLWPIFRQRQWADRGVDITQRQVGYFVYWSVTQRSATNPNAAPAQKSHLWPLYSSWDNGAGKRQLQVPSPLELFFPDNERIRVSWSPLFALYRYDQSTPDQSRHEALWGLISWRREPAHREFHFGPVLSVNEQSGEKRVAIGNGLLAWERSRPDAAWHLFWFDFPAKANKLRASTR
jgi:hypothetical protein